MIVFFAMRKPKPRPKNQIPQEFVEAGLKEVLFEFAKVGRHMKVNAIDARTGIEVSMIADPKYGRPLIKRLAMRKLAYVIKKNRSHSKASDSQSGWDM